MLRTSEFRIYGYQNKTKKFQDSTRTDAWERDFSHSTTMSNVEVAICARPGCDQSGPSLCGSCRLVGYCCRTCQVEDWPRHKEVDCQGHMRKIGMAHLQKALGFNRDRNWMQSLRYSELALVKLKPLNDRPIEAIDDALSYKFNALNFMGRSREALECAKERYCLTSGNILILLPSTLLLD